MAYYYKYTFISPEILYATVKEELKSYFDTGAVDDLLFPTYVDKCLRKLGRSSYVISEAILSMEDYEARLPDNFYAVREAWLCTEIQSAPYQSANSFYSQTDDPTTILISPLTTDQHSPGCHDPHCHGLCMPQLIQPVYKTNNQHAQVYKKQHLLKPGNISVRRNCDVEYNNEWNFYSQNTGNNNSFTPGSSGYDSFDIRDNKFVTNFRDGKVYLLIYITEYDNVGNQMIPDNFRIREYVESFLKYKVFETLYNQVNDETYNQIEKKMMLYKQASDEAFIMADIEIKKQTVYQKQRAIISNLKSFSRFELPGRTNRYGLRRNN